MSTTVAALPVLPPRPRPVRYLDVAHLLADVAAAGARFEREHGPALWHGLVVDHRDTDATLDAVSVARGERRQLLTARAAAGDPDARHELDTTRAPAPFAPDADEPGSRLPAQGTDPTTGE